jgi:hypothetical protein
MLLVMAISPFCNGQERMGVTGIFILASLLLLEVAISPASNGRERTAATGIALLVLLLLVMAISPSCNG